MVLEYVLSDRYTERINIAANDEKQKLERSRKVILKMYDHVNLAKRQYNELKESDDDFEMKFSKILKGGGCSSPILFAFFTPAPPRFGRVR